jgi:hypothetical protein
MKPLVRGDEGTSTSNQVPNKRKEKKRKEKKRKETNLSKKQQQTNKLALSSYDVAKVLKKMRIARDGVVDKETEEEETSVQNIVTNVHERLRTLQNERENDR